MSEAELKTQSILLRNQQYEAIRLSLNNLEVEINAQAKFLERKCKEVKPSRGFLDTLKQELMDQRETMIHSKDQLNIIRNTLDKLQVSEQVQEIPQPKPEESTWLWKLVTWS